MAGLRHRVWSGCYERELNPDDFSKREADALDECSDCRYMRHLFFHFRDARSLVFRRVIRRGKCSLVHSCVSENKKDTVLKPTASPVLACLPQTGGAYSVDK